MRNDEVACLGHRQQSGHGRQQVRDADHHCGHKCRSDGTLHDIAQPEAKDATACAYDHKSDVLRASPTRVTVFSLSSAVKRSISGCIQGSSHLFAGFRSPRSRTRSSQKPARWHSGHSSLSDGCCSAAGGAPTSESTSMSASGCPAAAVAIAAAAATAAERGAVPELCAAAAAAPSMSASESPAVRSIAVVSCVAARPGCRRWLLLEVLSCTLPAMDFSLHQRDRAHPSTQQSWIGVCITKAASAQL